MSRRSFISPISRDALSKDVPPPLSPFADMAMPQSAYRDLRHALANAVLPASAIQTLRLTMLSAVVFGALLDERALAALLGAARAGAIRANRVELSIWLKGKRQIHRRWFPDQRTHGLLQTLPHPIQSVATEAGVARQLATEAMHSLGCGNNFDWLMKQARLWWRLRLPAIVADHAEGLLLAGSVPPENWARITTGLGQEVPVNSMIAPRWTAKPTPSRAATQPTLSLAPSHIALAQDHAALLNALQAASNSSFNRYQVRQAALEALACVIPQSLMGQHLHDWLTACMSTGPLSVRPRGKPSFPVTPGTLENDLQNLPPVFLSAMDARQGDVEKLIDLLEEWIDAADSSSKQKSRAIAVRFLHRWLVQTAGWPALSIKIDDDGAPIPARARLVSEAEYKTALALADRLPPPITCPDATAAKIALMLGFRAGLRPAEATRPRLDDVLIDAETVILAVRSNQQFKAKTPNARRLLPLHLLLPPPELDLFIDYVRQRQHGPRNGEFLLPGNVGDLGSFVLDLLRRATGEKGVRRHDLRHSFASCFAATMLLPDPVPGQPNPAFPCHGYGPDCISIERRDVLRPRLLGYNLGRQSLFALTFLMGHAGPHRSANSYVHLLDWVLSLYVAQRHNGTLPIPRPPSRPAGRNVKAPQIVPKLPSLEALSRVFASPQVGEALRLVQAGFGTAGGARLVQRLKVILSIQTSKGTKRHHIGRVRKDEASDAAERIWRSICAQPAILADTEVAWALSEWLRRFDNERNDLPLENLAVAERFVAALQTLGFTQEQIAVRFRRKGDDKVGRWNAWPPGQTPLPSEAKPRIGLAGSHNGQINATPSLRLLVLFIAARAEFDLTGR